jgi:hypothetical protein
LRATLPRTTSRSTTPTTTLAAEGAIKEVAARLWSGFMGRIYKRRAVIEEAAPALAKELEKDRVDLFVLVPA